MIEEHASEARMHRRGGWYSAGWALVGLTCLGTVWTTIVRDDGTGASYFMIILATGVGALASRCDARGMGRTLAGVAGMQVALGLLTATAPITAQAPGGPGGAFLFNLVFAGLWLIAAAAFRASSRG